MQVCENKINAEGTKNKWTTHDKGIYVVGMLGLRGTSYVKTMMDSVLYVGIYLRRNTLLKHGQAFCTKNSTMAIGETKMLTIVKKYI